MLITGMALLLSCAPSQLVALRGLERRLAVELARRDPDRAAESARLCGALARRLSRRLRGRGMAGEAVGDSLLRESRLARDALASRRWADALVATRASEATLDDARRLAPGRR
jgi:hypothetical protein